MTISRSERRAARAPTAPPLERLRFAALYAYSPHGRGELAVCSRALRVRLKSGDPPCIARYAARVCEQWRAGRLPGSLFGPDVLLVPMPASTVSKRYVSQRLALALYRRGLAGGLWSGLRRTRSVQKSALAWIGERPSVHEHYASFALASSGASMCSRQMARRGSLPCRASVLPPGQAILSPGRVPGLAPTRLLIVDDVITKGRTLLAAAWRLRESFPDVEIGAFALAHTVGRGRDIERLVDPLEGEICWTGADARRTS